MQMPWLRAGAKFAVIVVTQGGLLLKKLALLETSKRIVSWRNEPVTPYFLAAFFVSPRTVGASGEGEQDCAP
jgi:hypothetical protein